jgi:hypothetical protein
MESAGNLLKKNFGSSIQNGNSSREVSRLNLPIAAISRDQIT